MGLHRYLLPIFILWLCYYSRYTNTMESPFPTRTDDEHLPYDIHAYPSYFRSNNQDNEWGSDLSIMDTWGHATTFKSSPTVDDFGAEADETSDTKGPLPTSINEESPYDTNAYPTYFDSIHSQDRKYGSDFPTSESLATAAAAKTSLTLVSVDLFGAKGDGRTDDTQAFEKAWKAACASASSVLVVPQNKIYLLKPITFSGPCKSSIKVMIQGTIKAPSNPSIWDKLDRRYWILFQKIKMLRVEGGGTIDGSGENWWKKSCKIDKSQPCTKAPTALTFYSCKDLVVNDLKIKNSQQIQLSFERCNNVQASNLVITAPEKSPNTDGVHVIRTQDIQIMNCVIGTGDDCISIKTGSENLTATNIKCGPGHGISVGSLGKDNSEALVSGVTIDGANIAGTTNGVRIKTWQGGSGTVHNIIFQNVAMHNVTRPIIINQNYCDSNKPCKEQDSAVEIRNVIYKNIKGTSASKVAVNFDCSKNFPCSDIFMQDINLQGFGGKSTTTSCKNVEGPSTKGVVYPPSCH